jgi:hypothetical protein
MKQPPVINWIKKLFSFFFIRKGKKQKHNSERENNRTKTINILPDWLIFQRKQNKKFYDSQERIRRPKILRAKIKRLTLSLNKYSNNPNKLKLVEDKIKQTEKELYAFLKEINPKRFFFF